MRALRPSAPLAAAILLLAAAVLLLAAAVPAGAADRVAISDVEDEVMCPICGTLLELTQAPQAQRQRAFIAEMIAAGAGKDEIKDALVAEYGEEVLAVPRGSGFQLSAYIVPVAAFALALLALAVGLWRWRRDPGERPPGQGPRGPEGEEARRLDADLARYDL
jgi:cytochrome c-type biogenesis protein CcmH/NrfF